MKTLGSRLAAELAAFRAGHPISTVRVGGDVWDYASGGAGLPAVVILPGGGGSAESMFTLNLALEPRFRTLSVAVPAAGDAARIVDGLEAVMDAAGVERAVLLGHSFGGAVAEAFAAARPERVAGLILSHFAHYQGARKLLPRIGGLVARLPQQRLLAMLNGRLADLVATADDPAFWTDFFAEELTRPDAAARFKGHLRLLGQMARQLDTRALAHAAIAIPVQIIGAEDDSGFTRAEIDALARLYPKARVAMLPKGAGHLSFATRPGAYLDIVLAFLRDVGTDEPAA